MNMQEMGHSAALTVEIFVLQKKMIINVCKPNFYWEVNTFLVLTYELVVPCRGAKQLESVPLLAC